MAGFNLRTAAGVVLAATVCVSLSGCFGQDNKLTERVTALELQNKLILERLVKLETPETTTTTTTDSTTTTTAAGKSFSDIADVENKKQIEDLAALNVFKDEGAIFKPYEKITRGDFAKWLVLASKKIRPEEESVRLAPQIAPKFKDVPATHAAYPYVQALANAGYSVGYTDGSFKADQPITREEAISMKTQADYGKSFPYNAKAPECSSIKNFQDNKQIDNRYLVAICNDNFYNDLYNFKRAYGNTKFFKPKEPVLRSEAVSMIWKMRGRDAFHPANNH